MLITICILFLAYSMLGRPVDKLLGKVKNVDWKRLGNSLWEKLVSFCCKAGMVTAKPLLALYYVLMSPGTSLKDKVLIYGALVYIVLPCDLVPRKVLGLIGVFDDAAILAFVLRKVKDNVTPDIETKVNETLVKWFGPSATEIPC